MFIGWKRHTRLCFQTTKEDWPSFLQNILYLSLDSCDGLFVHSTDSSLVGESLLEYSKARNHPKIIRPKHCKGYQVLAIMGATFISRSFLLFFLRSINGFFSRRLLQLLRASAGPLSSRRPWSEQTLVKYTASLKCLQSYGSVTHWCNIAVRFFWLVMKASIGLRKCVIHYIKSVWGLVTGATYLLQQGTQIRVPPHH